MKKLLLALSLISIPAAAQTEIQHFMGMKCPTCGLGFTDGYNERTYYLIETPAPVDESASGADLSWDFSGTQSDGSFYTVSEATDTQIGFFPNTNTVLTQSEGDFESMQIFSTDYTTFTGMVTPEFILSYSSDTASLGTFPVSYGYSNADTVAGTFEYGAYVGTFSGTINTSVDAYGTATFNDAGEPRDVTRLKVVQTLALSYPPFGQVGTFTQTIYHYYDADPFYNWPQIRSTTTSLSVPLLSVNDTYTIYEVQNQGFLANPEVAAGKIAVWPNPVKDKLLVSASGQGIEKIEISDALGKRVLSAANVSEIDLSALKTGMYFATVSTASGNEVKKIIKN